MVLSINARFFGSTSHEISLSSSKYSIFLFSARNVAVLHCSSLNAYDEFTILTSLFKLSCLSLKFVSPLPSRESVHDAPDMQLEVTYDGGTERVTVCAEDGTLAPRESSTIESVEIQVEYY